MMSFISTLCLCFQEIEEEDEMDNVDSGFDG